MHFIPLITALLQDELILHKEVFNYRLLSKTVKITVKKCIKWHWLHTFCA